QKYPMNLLVLAVVSFFTISAHSEWLCREASSIRNGNTIEACGVGYDLDLQASKNQARESAISEFDRICSNDSFCNHHEVNVHPKRTECVRESSHFRCFRAIDFEITGRKKSEIFVDVEVVRSQLEEKRKLLSNLQEQLYQLENLKKVDEE